MAVSGNSHLRIAAKAHGEGIGELPLDVEMNLGPEDPLKLFEAELEEKIDGQSYMRAHAYKRMMVDRRMHLPTCLHTSA
jgi:hypothetical protein